MKIKTNCDCCRRVLLKFKSISNRNKHNFCNLACYRKWQKRNSFMKKVKCAYCHKIIIRTAFRIARCKHNFCNRNCFNRYQKKYWHGNKHPGYSSKKIRCDYCQKYMRISLWRLKTYKKHCCSKECRNKLRTKHCTDKVRCDYCKKSIIVYKARFKRMKNRRHNFCSDECSRKFHIGKNHQNWHGGTIEVTCTICKKVILRSKSAVKRYKVFFCTRKCQDQWRSKSLSGKNCHLWCNGISLELYGIEFNQNLKQFIRDRDKHYCQNPECGIPEKECLRKLHIHHIDYDKKNNDPINLIALCNSCNARANGNRDYWKKYYQRIQIGRKVHELEKSWKN